MIRCPHGSTVLLSGDTMAFLGKIRAAVDAGLALAGQRLIEAVMGQRSAGAKRKTAGSGQRRNPDRARQRKLTRQLGGRRQYLLTMKALRRHRAGLVAGDFLDARGASNADRLLQVA